MLDGVRNNLLSGWPLVIIISICALPFVFLGTGSLGTVFGQNYGSVNGEIVEEIDIQVAQNRVIQNYKEIFGEDFDFGVLSPEQQAQAISDEIIRQKVVLSEVNSLGLINKEQVKNSKKEILRNQDFYIDGKFDEGRFEAYVNANGFTKEQFIEMFSRIESTNDYIQSISSNFVTDEEIKDFIKLIEKTIDINFIKISFDELLNEVSSTLEEQNEYYLNNKESFMSDETRAFSYFVLSTENFIENINIPADYFKEAYEAYSKEVLNSEQKRIAHIMIDKTNYESEAEAMNAAKSIEDKLLAGEDFFELVSQLSEDPLTKDSNGDLDYFSDDLFPTEFSEIVNELSLDEFSAVVELETSLHILKVTEVYKDELLSFEEKKSSFEKEIIEAESLAILNEEYFKILDLIDSNISFADISNSYNADVVSSESISYNNFSVDELDVIKDELFQTNNTNNVFLDNEIMIVYSIDEVKEPSVLPFAESQASINEILNNQKAIELRENILLEAETVTKENLESFASKYKNFTVENFVNLRSNASILPRLVVNKMFESEIDSINLIASSEDYYLVSLEGINLPSDEVVLSLVDEYEDLTKDQLDNKLFDMINNELYTNIRNDLRIGVN